MIKYKIDQSSLYAKLKYTFPLKLYESMFPEM